MSTNVVTHNSILMNRTWAMPSASTFTIKPIRELVKRYLNKAEVSIDPFARNCGWATYTNDLSPDTTAGYHLPASEFLELMVERGVQADVVLFDPPYSLLKPVRLGVRGGSQESSMKQRIYISGKITGLDHDEAFAAFENAEKFVEALGYDAVNPMKLVAQRPGNEWIDRMVEHSRILNQCDGIFMMSNWQDSDVAKLQMAFCIVRKKKIMYDALRATYVSGIKEGEVAI